ncbi:MAG: hypothetical protein AL399_08490, partial [Candidatus [Bacteroides] periocalifornicus]
QRRRYGVGTAKVRRWWWHGPYFPLFTQIASSTIPAMLDVFFGWKMGILTPENGRRASQRGVAAGWARGNSKSVAASRAATLLGKCM